MKPRFDALDTNLSAAISGVFAEPARLQPRKSTQYAERAADPDRAGVIIHGIFSAGPAQSDLRGEARGRPFAGTTQLVSTVASFWIAKAELTALTALPAKGDTITFTSRVGSPVYAITTIQHTDMGDLTLDLVREDQPS